MVHARRSGRLCLTDLTDRTYHVYSRYEPVSPIFLRKIIFTLRFKERLKNIPFAILRVLSASALKHTVLATVLDSKNNRVVRKSLRSI